MMIDEALTTTLENGLTELHTTTTATDKRTPDDVIWAEPAIPPSPSPPCERTSGDTLWTEATGDPPLTDTTCNSYVVEFLYFC